MRRITIVAAIFISLCADSAFAQTYIKAEVDKTTLSADEVLTYKVTVTSAEKNIPSPELPKFNGFKVVSSAQSSSMTFTKGEMKAIVVYAFVLFPSQTGKIKIGPSTIKIEKETFSTGTFEIEVKEGAPGARPEQKVPPAKTSPEETSPEETEEYPRITL